jgi:hypothetical protein
MFGFSNVKTIGTTLNINKEGICFLSISVISLELTKWCEGAVFSMRLEAKENKAYNSGFLVCYALPAGSY